MTTAGKCEKVAIELLEVTGVVNYWFHDGWQTCKKASPVGWRDWPFQESISAMLTPAQSNGLVFFN